MAFDKRKYDIEYMNKNRKQFRASLKKEEYEELMDLLKIYNLSNVDFVRIGKDNLKKKKLWKMSFFFCFQKH